MPDDRVWSAAEIGSDKVIELLKAITAGREPPPTEEEWASLRDFWRGKLGNQKRGQHKLPWRQMQGINRRTLRTLMERQKTELRDDPAERELKRAMRANGEPYDLNKRVAHRMHEELTACGAKTISEERLLNMLRRSTAIEEPREP